MFGPRQSNGEIAAHKLAEIVVSLVDDANEQPLEVRGNLKLFFQFTLYPAYQMYTEEDTSPHYIFDTLRVK